MDQKYEYGTAKNREFLNHESEELIKFGQSFPSDGGSSYYLGTSGEPCRDKSHETYVTSRMAHVYTLAALLGKDGCEKLVDQALNGLMGELHDKKNGGWFSGITPDGKPLPDKLCYAHAFVILAASSALLIKRPGAQKLLDEALTIYDRYFWDEKNGLARDTWNTEFTVCSPYRGLNANMHSVESFLAVADVTGDKTYRNRAGRIIEHVIKWAYDNNWRIPEHFTQDWEPNYNCNKEKPDDPFKPYGATPGHGIEWARLIAQWAISEWPDDKMKRSKYIYASEQLFCRAVTDSWAADGEPGIVYTTDWDGCPVVHDRMHWTLAEGINTSATLYQITKKDEYKKYYAAFMKYLDEKVIDHVNGSWFHQLDRHNQVLDTVWPGKPDLYHALQATLIPYQKPGISVVKGIPYKYMEMPSGVNEFAGEHQISLHQYG